MKLFNGLIPNVLSATFWQHFWEEVKLTWRLMRSPQVSFALKLIPALAMIYFLSPIELIPSIVPVLGQMDDLTVVLFAVRLFNQLATPDDGTAVPQAA